MRAAFDVKKKEKRGKKWRSVKKRARRIVSFLLFLCGFRLGGQEGMSLASFGSFDIFLRPGIGPGARNGIRRRFHVINDRFEPGGWSEKRAKRERESVILLCCFVKIYSSRARILKTFETRF